MASTHAVEVGSATVVKRFRRWDQDEHRREWRALTLLAEHMPGPAPAPGFPVGNLANSLWDGDWVRSFT
jgi:hypothetical protein